jgi:hypothetical protein
VLRSFARANISQMQRENAKQYKILRAFCLPQVQIFAAQNRVSSTLFGYMIFLPQLTPCVHTFFTNKFVQSTIFLRFFCVYKDRGIDIREDPV